MKKAVYVLVLGAALALAGCGSFGAGLRDGFEASLPGAVADVVADRVEKRNGDLADAIRKLPDSMPKPKDPPDNTVSYGLAFLVAKLIGDSAGAIARSTVGKKTA